MRCFACDSENGKYDSLTRRDYCDDCMEVIQSMLLDLEEDVYEISTDEDTPTMPEVWT